MVLFLGFLFCFIYLCDSSMQFWLMELCNTVWSQGAWYFELCSFFHKIVSVIWSLLWLHIYFRIICSSLMKNVTVNFNRDWIKSVISFGIMEILRILILPIRKHRISFYFFEEIQLLFFSDHEMICLLWKCWWKNERQSIIKKLKLWGK